MKSKFLKYSLLTIGIIGVAYGSFKLSDIISGRVRKRFATYKVVDVKEAPVSSDKIE